MLRWGQTLRIAFYLSLVLLLVLTVLITVITVTRCTTVLIVWTDHSSRPHPGAPVDAARLHSVVVSGLSRLCLCHVLSHWNVNVGLMKNSFILIIDIWLLFSHKCWPKSLISFMIHQISTLLPTFQQWKIFMLHILHIKLFWISLPIFNICWKFIFVYFSTGIFAESLC